MASHSRVLLTGATGNLGRGIAASLPKGSVCLVRKHSPMLGELGMTQVIGDTSKHNWGISLQGIGHNGGRITKIIHCAADLGTRKPLSSLMGVNVLSVDVLISALGHGIDVDYFSSLSVFASSNIDRGRNGTRTRCLPDATLSNLNGLTHIGGYAQSKAMAERRLLNNTSGYRGRLRIIRPALVVGEVPREFFNQFHSGLRSIGCVPEVVPHREVNFMGTEELVEKYIGLAENASGIYHMCNRQNTSLEELVRGLGLPASNSAFYERVKLLPRLQKNIILNGFSQDPIPASQHQFDIFHSTGLSYE